MASCVQCFRARIGLHHVGALTWPALLVMMSMTAACDTVREAIQGMDRPSARVKDVGLEDLDLEGLTLRFDVDVSNPYAVALPLTDIAYELKSEGASLASGAAPLKGSIPARGSRVVELPARLVFVDLFDTARGIRPGAVVPYEASLDLSVDAPGTGPLSLPLQTEGRFPIPAAPTVALERVHWDELTLNNAKATLDLNIGNPNAFDLDLAALEYALALGGYDIASAEAQRSTRITADGESMVRIPISVSPLKIGMAAFNLFRGSGSDYTIGGTMEVDTPYGPMALPFERSGQTTFSD